MNHLELGNHSCVIRTAGGEILTSDAHGILPPLTWLREDPVTLKGADVADKVIGKAAALLFCYGGARSIWAGMMSEAARDLLDTTDIAYAYGVLVPAILNRGGTDLCPMERRAMAIGDPAEAFALFDGLVK